MAKTLISLEIIKMEMEIKKTKTYKDESSITEQFDILVDGRSVGQGTMILDDEMPYLERIDIDAEYRGKGLGTHALYELRNIYGSFLTAPDNEGSKRLMERIGTENTDGLPMDQGFGVYEI